MDAEQSPYRPSGLSSRAVPKRRSPLFRLHWLLVAVGLCWLSWPVPAEAQPACAHDLCEVGDYLSEVCDPCVDDICSDPRDQNQNRFCCTDEWDQYCVGQVLVICGDPRCEQVCSHSPCEIGGAIDSTCNSCTAAVCFVHPECCTDDGDPLTDDWSATCVLAVQQECGIQCEPGADQCSNATPIHTGTIIGTLLGASNDGCESGHNSCSSADVWYEYTQLEDQDMLVSTCATQRSFGIDTVVSVHEGATVQERCPGRPNNEIIENDDWRLGPAPQACFGIATPNLVDAAVPLGASLALEPGETVVIRVAHHADSVKNNFQLRVLPEPEGWLALVAGAGALGALSRRRARG
jgi:hypothetical protein